MKRFEFYQQLRLQPSLPARKELVFSTDIENDAIKKAEVYYHNFEQSASQCHKVYEQGVEVKMPVLIARKTIKLVQKK